MIYALRVVMFVETVTRIMNAYGVSREYITGSTCSFIILMTPILQFFFFF